MSHRLCGVHVVAEAMDPLGEEITQLLPLEALGRDVGPLHGTVNMGGQERETAVGRTDSQSDTHKDRQTRNACQKCR